MRNAPARNRWSISPETCPPEGLKKVYERVKGGKWFEEMGVGKSLPEYDSLVVLTHLKGHTMGGFGGSNKNVGIGCADGRVSKGMVHGSGSNPWVAV